MKDTGRTWQMDSRNEARLQTSDSHKHRYMPCKTSSWERSGLQRSKNCNCTCCEESLAHFWVVSKILLWTQFHRALLGCGKAGCSAAMWLLIQTLVCAWPRHPGLCSTTHDPPVLPQSLALHWRLCQRYGCYSSRESQQKIKSHRRLGVDDWKFSD